MADKAVRGSSLGGSNLFRTLFPVFIIVLCYLVATYVFYNVFGAKTNFEGDDPIKGHPLNIYGTIFKGGFVIPIGLTLLLTMLVFCVERAFTIGRAWGIKTLIIFVLLLLIVIGTVSLFAISNYFLLLVVELIVCAAIFFILKNDSLDSFVSTLRTQLANGDVASAMRECDAKQNSVGNVVKAGLKKFDEMTTSDLDKEEKKELIKAEMEKATMLELPSLDRNLSILATVASLGTLVGLIGTVLGMIRSFQALGAGGAPNAAELSVGISEALVNTAIGITTSALAIFFYNMFTTKIDSITYKMEEVGYSIVQAFDKRK